MSPQSTALTLSFLLSSGVLVTSVPAQDVRWLDLPALRFGMPDDMQEPEALPVPHPPSPPPLFTAETMARDAAPVMVQFANQRTLDNARLVYDFQEQKVQAIREMTLLLQQIAQERKRK